MIETILLKTLIMTGSFHIKHHLPLFNGPVNNRFFLFLLSLFSLKNYAVVNDHTIVKQ